MGLWPLNVPLATNRPRTGVDESGCRYNPDCLRLITREEWSSLSLDTTHSRGRQSREVLRSNQCAFSARLHDGCVSATSQSWSSPLARTEIELCALQTENTKSRRTAQTACTLDCELAHCNCCGEPFSACVSRPPCAQHRTGTTGHSWHQCQPDDDGS